MSRLSARRLASTCALSAALAAFAVPATASAHKGKTGKSKENCSSGLAINGEGSSAQKVAQQTVWIPGFEKSANKNACSGTQGGKQAPKVTYAPEGSGAGLKAFGAEGESIFHGKVVQYAGTDEAPNSTQKSEIEGHSSGIKQTPVLATLPVAQFAVSVPIHLPTGCTATSAITTGRLVLENKTLNSVWLGKISTWGELIAAETAGAPANKDEIKGAGCLTATITHVVRLDQSGTTHTFKKYLGIISTEKVEFENASKEPVGEKDWDETAEGKENQSWPVADHVIRPAKKGGGEEVALVAATASSIGYVNLAEARANAAFVSPGGPGSATFWVETQNSGTATETEAGKKQKYADPSTNGEIAAPASSNCVKEKYTNGKGTKFPPKSVFDEWNNVTSETKQKNYPLCGLTYDLEVAYENSFIEPPAVGQATTAENYLAYVLNEETAGGQTELNKEHDYLSIGAKLDKEAKAGLAELFEEE